MSLTAARDVWRERARLRPPAPAMTITDNGLVLGATVLAPMRRGAGGISALAIDGAEESLPALLSAAYRNAYRKAVGGGVLQNIRRATQYWGEGETHLASIELALAGLPPLDDAEQASLHLFLADKLLADGLSSRELMRLSGIDRALLDVIKGDYNPDQPRVPAGNPDGGQWRKRTTRRCENRHPAGRRADLGRKSADTADCATTCRFPSCLRGRTGDRVNASV